MQSATSVAGYECGAVARTALFFNFFRRSFLSR